MARHWAFFGMLLLIGVGAMAFRAPKLNDRPMHNDEAVHCDKFRILWETGKYVYDPYEYHGPPHYYLAMPVLWATGTKTYAQSEEWQYRIVPAAFGAGLVLLLALTWDALGKGATLAAGVLTAASPAMVYYSRYYIQEILLVFFTFLAIGAAWRYARRPKVGWLVLCGLGVGLMHATKETWVIQGFAAVCGIVAAAVWTRMVDGRWMGMRGVVKGWHVGAAAVAGAAIAFVILSGFFTNLRGPWDSILTYTTYLNRGTKPTLHDQPWHYYLKLLTYNRYGRGPIWSEGLILGLFVVGLIPALWRYRGAAKADAAADDAAAEADRLGRQRAFFLRFLAFYTLALTTGYSIIHYKTPWCMLGFEHGMILLGGLGAAGLVRAMPHWTLRGVVGLALAGLTVQLGMQAHRASFHPRWMVDASNPYAHSPTRRQALELAEMLTKVAAASPQGSRLRMNVLTIDCWPLPWYLRALEGVGYWPAPTAENAKAPVVIAEPEAQEMLEQFNETLRPEYQQYQRLYYGLRPAVPRVVYIRKDLWDAYLRAKQARR